MYMYVCLYTPICMSPFINTSHGHQPTQRGHLISPQFGMLTIEPSDRDLFQANLSKRLEATCIFHMKKKYKMYFRISKNE